MIDRKYWNSVVRDEEYKQGHMRNWAAALTPGEIEVDATMGWLEAFNNGTVHHFEKEVAGEIILTVKEVLDGGC